MVSIFINIITSYKHTLLYIFILLVICFSFISCKYNSKTNVDLSLLKRELNWYSSYSSVKEKLESKLQLVYSNTVTSGNNKSYFYLGGSFKGIETANWKFIFTQDALEAICIWINGRSIEQNENYYQLLTKYFNGVAKYEAGRNYESWIYDEDYYGPPKLHDTNILLEKAGTSILIKIIHSVNATESH